MAGLKNRKIISATVGTLFLLNALAWIAVFNLNQKKFLEVNFFNVGQGDAIFIETSQLHQVLIDGGPDSAVLEKLSQEMPFWDRSLDMIILTHPEKDHISGLLEVLKRYKVDYIVWNGVKRKTTEYEEWLNLIGGSKAQVKIVHAGQKIKLGDAVLDIIYPFENLENKEMDESNDSSIVMKLKNGETSFLFTGDISGVAEKTILQKGIDLDSDVLKVSHHGSKTAENEDFLFAISPIFSVISVGRNNSYGHPHQKVLESLVKFAIKILRTDLNGDIKIISDGENLKFNQN
ncbi:MAG: ComEC/Rec2 family competence protein [Patescibacteria group bacterium]